MLVSCEMKLCVIRLWISHQKNRMQDDQKCTLPDGRMVCEDPFYLLYGDSGVRVVAALM